MSRVFHVTPTANVDSILASGLEPRIGPRSSELGEAQPRVYLFVRREDAIEAVTNWMGEAFDDEPLSLLTVQRGGLPLAVTEGFDVEVTCDQLIPPGLIQHIEPLD